MYISQQAKQHARVARENGAWIVSMPINIALIKYMGKRSLQRNLPLNASLSYTVGHCWSQVSIECIDGLHDQCVADITLDHSGFLSDKAIERFILHAKRIKTMLHCSQAFLIKTGNNFPASCGLASSASSFAALSLVLVRCLEEITKAKQPMSIKAIAELSQQASGSSCRSFYVPWALWEPDQGVKALTLPYERLLHAVVVVDQSAKAVSSSQAHQRVMQSSLMKGRDDRAEKRLTDLLHALGNSCWKKAFHLIREEFLDMHALFETANPAFSYMTDASFSVLRYVEAYWKKHQDGPWITLDAGPNVHLFFRPDQRQIVDEMISQLAEKHVIISS
jgi:diphosphomevalonate decarboxylase